MSWTKATQKELKREVERITKEFDKLADEIEYEEMILAAYLQKTGSANVQKRARDDLSPFIFTYGSDDSYPYYGGWCVIYAKGKSEACDIHKDKYGLYNFAFCYSAEEFEKTEMCESGNLGNYCHAVHNYRRV